MTLAAPGITDPAIGLKHRIADRSAVIDRIKTAAGIEIRSFAAAADVALIGRLELWQLTRGFIVNGRLDRIIPGLVIANIHGRNSESAYVFQPYTKSRKIARMPVKLQVKCAAG